ncbi:MAG TPA: type I DNA topoisomerase, partial [Chloroflexota bacterium]|nr:type I DNA topoisomerase [Chloroflexota bacterium]
TKARTISAILGPQYRVMASKGHVVDLPEHGLGYDEETFDPIYEVSDKRKKDIAALKDAARHVDRVIIATDPDREGEAIGWHVARQLGAVDPERLEFHEITPRAVREALANPRRIDGSLVDAQQARRVLDRMVGYKASPALWRTVKRGLSAGRVQSVAMALVADREREIMAFQEREYWTVHLTMQRADQTTFLAELRLLDGNDVRLVEDKPPLLGNEQTAQQALEHALGRSWHVEKMDRSQYRRKPNPPFTTSTLQQAAGSNLSFGPKRTMSAAQSLYERGLITYMRTDSVAIAADAIVAAREVITHAWGADFVPKEPRHYSNKATAQGAHESIRPTDPARESVGDDLDEDARRLYKLIRARFLACQAADAVYDRRSADIVDPSCGCAVRARSSRVVFPGWLTVSGIREEEDEAEGLQELPDLRPGEPLAALDGTKERHETQPPPRYTEASLVKALEDRGVGRPSTYAPTVEAIVERGYANKEGRALRATPLALTVTDWARERLPDLVDPAFTARVEEDLDRIAEGGQAWKEFVGRFATDFLPAATRAAEAGRVKVEGPPPEPIGEQCPECGGDLVKRTGRFGEFISCSNYPTCKYKPPKALPPVPEGTEAPACPVCGSAMVLRQAQRGRGRGSVFWGCSNYPSCKGLIAVEGNTAAPEPKVDPQLAAAAPPCPNCGKPMAVRTARKGPNAGKPFFGCTGYPKCKTVVAINETTPAQEPVGSAR